MGEAAALASALSWAVAGVAVTSLSTRLPAAALSALQMVIASAALLVILMVSNSAAEFGEAETLTLLGVAGSAIVGLSLADPIYVRALSIMGMQRTYPVTVGLFIVLTAAAGVLILDEEFTVGLLAGGVLIGLGCYLIVIPRGKQRPAEELSSPLAAPAAAPRQLHEHRLEGYVMLGLAPLLWATATVWLASARGELSPIAASALRMPVGAGLLMLFLLSVRPHDLKRAAANRRDLVMIAGAGLVGMAGGSLLYVYALMEAGAARAAVLSASSPLFVIPLSMLFLNEILTRRILMGTAISVTGIVLVITL